MCRARDLPGQVWEALFYIYTIIYSKLVLNQNGFLFSAELKCYFEERGKSSGGQSTQIKYLSKSTDTYNKILLQ